MAEPVTCRAEYCVELIEMKANTLYSCVAPGMPVEVVCFDACLCVCLWLWRGSLRMILLGFSPVNHHVHLPVSPHLPPHTHTLLSTTVGNAYPFHRFWFLCVED
jgi:hypothetical protein